MGLDTLLAIVAAAAWLVSGIFGLYLLSLPIKRRYIEIHDCNKKLVTMILLISPTHMMSATEGGWGVSIIQTFFLQGREEG